MTCLKETPFHCVGVGTCYRVDIRHACCGLQCNVCSRVDLTFHERRGSQLLLLNLSPHVFSISLCSVSVESIVILIPILRLYYIFEPVIN